MYADEVTDSMDRAITETERRRAIQMAYNAEHGIVPKTIVKAIPDRLRSATRLRMQDEHPADGQARARSRH